MKLIDLTIGINGINTNDSYLVNLTFICNCNSPQTVCFRMLESSSLLTGHQLYFLMVITKITKPLRLLLLETVFKSVSGV